MKFSISATVLLWTCIGFISGFQKRSTVCETTTCKQTAEYILNNIDETQDPCQDFYQFACGGFIARNPLPKAMLSYGNADILNNNAIEIVQGILETTNPNTTPAVANAQSLFTKQEDDVSLLSDEIKSLGGWPITTPSVIPNNSSFESLLARLTLRGVNAIISTYVSVDLENSSRFIISVSNGALLVNPMSSLKNQTIMEIYIQFLQFCAEALGAPKTQATATQANETIQFGEQLAMIIPEQSATINFTEVYQKMTIGQLQQFTDPGVQVFNWLTYFNEIFNSTLTSDDLVNVNDLNYFNQVLQLINSTDRNTVTNYVLWLFVGEYSSYAGGALKQATNTINDIVLGITGILPTNTTCTQFVNIAFGFALAKQYVAEAFPASNIQQVQQIAQLIQSIWTTGLTELFVNDSQTSSEFVQKVASMKFLIGYPKWINNDKTVQELYSNFPPMNGAYFTNVLNSVISLVGQNLNLLHTTVDKNRFNIIPSLVGIDYNQNSNTITLTAALLQQPYYTPGQLKSLQLGSLGSLIGFLINYGVNSIGSQFDANGNLNDWWPNYVQEYADEVISCVTNQYNGYCSPTDPQTCINGNTTSLMHLSQLYGILGSYSAYQTWQSKHPQEPQLPGLSNYTSNQLLFIGFAQTYCSATVPAQITKVLGTDPQLENRYSVNGALANLPEFAQTFQCNLGLMNSGNSSCLTV